MIELKERYEYYKTLETSGEYANPYTCREELDDLLSKSDLKFESEKWLEWSDKICDLSLEFFEM